VKRGEAGFTIPELALAGALLLVVLGGTLRVVDSSARAGGASVARTAAIDAAEVVADRLVTELRQSSSDTTLPGVRRYTIVGNGVRFQRVVGVATDPGTFGQQVWSPEIAYLFDPSTGTVRRSEGAAEPRVLAEGITAFSVRATGGGELVVAVGAWQRDGTGNSIAVTRERRVTPRNRAS